MKGRKVELKPFEHKHIAKLVEWRNDPEVAYWSTGNEPIYELVTLEEAEISFSNNLTGGSKLDAYMLAVYTLEGQYIGVVDYREVDRIKRSCTVGIMIGDKGYWGKGYGTDALQALEAFLFDRLNLRRIQIDTWSGNERAIRAFRKCGFNVEGTLKESEYIDGKYYDTVLMGILRRNWELNNMNHTENKQK